MKKLFLASSANLTLDRLSELIPGPLSGLKLVFIPTAANLCLDKSWLFEDRDKLVEMGFDVRDIDIENKDQEYLEKELKNVDVVFVSGGNSFYLLDQVKKSGFDEVIKELIKKGVVYIGSSAGSVLACPTVAAVEGLDDPKDAPDLKSYDALGLVDYLIFPHYGELEYENEYKKILTKWKDKQYEIKLLKNNQAIIVNGDDYRIVEADEF